MKKKSQEPYDPRAILYHKLIDIGISSEKAHLIACDAGIGAVNKLYLLQMGFKGRDLLKVGNRVKNFYFESSDFNNLANTENFFNFDKEYVYFFGKDIENKRIKINKQIEKIMKKYKYENDDDIIEIFDEESINFFKEVYSKY